MSEPEPESLSIDLSEIGHKDIQFLEAVKAINENPDEFEKTEQSKVPANTTTIREATSLNRNEVSYRIGGKRANNAGFGEDGLGLLRVHKAEPYKGTMGPKSAELTEKGVRVLDRLKEQRGLGDDGGGGAAEVPDEIGAQVADVKAAMNDLEAELAELSEQVARMEDAEAGALGDDYAAVVESVATGFPAHDQIFSEVFGIDTTEFRGEVDPETVQEQRERALEKLRNGT